ncbi:MAG: hypothetical protein EOM59_12930 [Clostridia bacterium]|nr:hypothetical protein [Clostridia bacterium]
MYKLMNQGIMKDEAGKYSKAKRKVITTEGEVEVDVEYVMRESDGALIPCVEGNADYAQYLQDVAGGAVVENFDYSAEESRQEVAKNKPKEKTLEERIAALEAKAK